MRTLTRHSRIHYMDQCITKYVLHLYTKDTVLYSVVITRQSNPPISQFNSMCNEFTSVWSMFVYNTRIACVPDPCTQMYYYTVVCDPGNAISGLLLNPSPHTAVLGNPTWPAEIWKDMIC